MEMTLGEKIALYRKRKGLTQRELADACGIAQADMWRIESGTTKNPHWLRMVALASALGVSLDDLAGRNGSRGT